VELFAVHPLVFWHGALMRETRAYVDPVLFDRGMGEVVVTRRKNRRQWELGVFLVDVFCLGVKNALFDVCDEGNERLDRFFPEGVPEPLPGAYGRKLVEGAIAYAASLGFAPHRDCAKASRVFGGITAADCPETFVFGKEGKPLYINGPYDDAEKIIRLLAARLGEENFSYIARLGEDD